MHKYIIKILMYGLLYITMYIFQIGTCMFRLFKNKNEWQKTEQVPIPLSRAPRTSLLLKQVHCKYIHWKYNETNALLAFNKCCDVPSYNRYMTGWRLWTGTGDLVTGWPDNSGEPGAILWQHQTYINCSSVVLNQMTGVLQRNNILCRDHNKDNLEPALACTFIVMITDGDHVQSAHQAWGHGLRSSYAGSQ